MILWHGLDTHQLKIVCTDKAENTAVNEREAKHIN